jgi:pyridoxine 4-dehydrogenase
LCLSINGFRGVVSIAGLAPLPALRRKLQSSILSKVAARLGKTPMQVALAWLLHRAPNILLIPGTSPVAHLRENLAAAEFDLPDDVLKELDGVANSKAA